MKSVLPPAALDQHVIALGKTGSGKSSKLRFLVEQLLDKGKPVTLIDPKGDWWGIKSSSDGKSAGYPVMIFGGEHADVPLNPQAGAHVAELVATGNRPALLDLGGWMVGERTRFFIDFASSFFRFCRGSRYLVIDEVHNFAPQGKVLDVDAGKCLHWANRIASEGRGKGVTIMAASQRPQKVHKDFLTSCETLIAGRVIHKLDRDAIKDWIDGCADPEKGKRVILELAGMQRTEAWVWSPEIDFGPLRTEFPMFKTYDSFKPQAGDRTVQLKGWATVNLEEVKTKLASVIEKAKENDPVELQRTIAGLRRDLRQRTEDAPTPAWRVEYEAAHAKDTAAAFEQGRDGVLQKVGIRVSRLQAELSELASMVANTDNPPPMKLRFQALEPPREQVKPIQRAAGRPTNGLAGPQQRILDAIAWWNVVKSDSPSRVQVAVVAKYSPEGGAFQNPLGSLRSSGLIDYPSPGVVALTTEGRKLARLPGATPTTDELHQRVLGILDGPKQRILRPLLDCYPSDMSREELAAAASYDAGGGAFQNPLGGLRSLGLIGYPAAGRVAALPILFL